MTMQYHNNDYRLEETLSTAAEINWNFPTDLNERRNKSPWKNPWKDYKLLFVSLHPLNYLLALFACFTFLFFFHMIATLALGDAC